VLEIIQRNIHIHTERFVTRLCFHCEMAAFTNTLEDGVYRLLPGPLSRPENFHCEKQRGYVR
jgi:hypothetical protein